MIGSIQPIFDSVNDSTILVAPKGMPTVIIHGINDDVVPISCSIEYVEKSGEEIIEFNKVLDGHRLSESHNFILVGVEKLLAY